MPPGIPGQGPNNGGRNEPHGTIYQTELVQEASVPAAPVKGHQMIHGKWCLNPSKVI